MGTSVWGEAPLITDLSRAVRRPRRRRLLRSPRVVAAGAVAAAAAVLTLGGNVYGGFNVGAPPVHVKVHAGDTLWAIAAGHYRSGDVRDHIDQIISLNRLGSSSISPGEDLLLPAPGS